MEKYFKCLKSVQTGKKYITENSIVVYQELTQTGGSKKTSIFVQGLDRKLNINSFNELISRNVLLEISESPELISYVDSYVIEPKEYSDRKKLLNKAKKELPQYEDILSTLLTWIFSTKGSKAATLAAQKAFIENPDKFLAETIRRGGMKAKPGSPYKNRGTRQTAVSDITKWEADDTTLLPNGIRKSDLCCYKENCRIFDEILSVLLSIIDIPPDFYNYFLSLGYESRKRKLVDYRSKKIISWELFKQNTHHSKVKGLEFCHIDPDKEFATTVDNVTIGTCESNRHQGGYSDDYTFRVLLIKEIYDLISNDDNYLTLQSELDLLTKKELILMRAELETK
jgi:hypothetical protein